MQTDDQMVFKGSKRFFFENKWFREPDLLQVVEGSWVGSDMILLRNRLIEMATSLQDWVSSVIENFVRRFKIVRMIWRYYVVVIHLMM